MGQIFIVIFGLIIGSFLNVVIIRLPQKISLYKPGSYCPKCKTPIKFYHNIPVISYLLLMGKCKSCKAKISLQYPLVEITTALSFLLIYDFWRYYPVQGIFTGLFIAIIIVLGLIDLKHMILPDELTLGGTIIFLTYSFFNPINYPTPLDSFISGFGAALVFTIIYFYYLKVRQLEGLGFGDVKMMLLLGAFLGIQKLVITILLASFSGLIVGLYFVIFKKKNLKFALPFGTFLSLGSIIAVFWGIPILNWIQSILLSFK